jgi:hypothetical protein
MDFELFGIVLLAFLAGCYLGWRVHETFIIHIIKTDPKTIEEALAIARKGSEEQEVTLQTEDGESVTTKAVELDIEMVKGVLYAYAKANNQFIAQGESIEDLLKMAHARFPGKNFFGNLPPEETNQKS